jgi:anaerobic C4-dicarboxylate transporter DcuA
VIIGICLYGNEEKNLSEDPEFQERMKDPTFAANLEGAEKIKKNLYLAPGAIKSVIIFAVAIIVAVVVLGSFPQLLPDFW